MTFGQTLQALRKRVGLSQTALATKSRTPIDSVRNWEQDRVLPRLDAAARLARSLGVTLDELAAGLASQKARASKKKDGK